MTDIMCEVQGLFNQQAGLTSNGSSGNPGGLQAEVDSLMRAGYLDPSQGSNTALQVCTGFHWVEI